jgi:beta-lactamase regulating signal transducer with metallopeptidase domain
MIRPMDSALLVAVVDAAVRGTFILLAALAATALMRRSSASARHLVWLAALTALLLLPVARGFVPEWRVLPAAPLVLAAPAPAAANLAERAAPSGARGIAAEVPRSAAVSAPQPAPLRLPADWKTLALLAWAAGAALFGVRLAYGLVRVRWIQRHATEMTDDAWVRLTDGLARRLRLGRIVRLLREPGATVPMTWGVFNPVILLPGEADEWDDERRRVVLAHELAHVRRWDALTQWVAHLALAVYWFNPLVWVAARKLREEREHACDDAVLEIGTRPVEYADHLLDIVRSLGSTHGPVAALAMARRSQFEGRMLAILDGAVRRTAVSRAAGLATAAAALACLVPLAALRPAEAAAHPPVSAQTSIRTPAGGAVTQASPLRRVVQRLRGDVDALGEKRETLGSAADGLASARTALAAQTAAPAAIVAAPTGIAGPVTTASLIDALDGAPDPGLYAEIIRAAEEIKSATERRLVLSRLLEQSDLSRDNVVAIIGATRTMDSDTERRIVLAGAIEHDAFPRTGAVPEVLFESLRGFTSATEQRIVLMSLLERGRLDPAALISIFRRIADVSSDTERRLVLTSAAESQRIEGAARDAYLAAARTIGSDGERAIVISALLDASPAPAEPAPPARPRTESAPREPGPGESLWSSTNEYDVTRDGERSYVRIHVQDAIFAGERWNVRGFRHGGSLMVEERAGRHTRHVEASCDGAGNPVWRFTVDGRVRPFDAAARSWMERVIRQSTT